MAKLSHRDKWTEVTPAWPIFVSGDWQADAASATVDALVAGGNLPFHGIFSRGMLEQWAAMGWATTRGELDDRAAWWPESAPLLEHCWNVARRESTVEELSADWADAGRALDGLLASRGVPLRRGHGDIPLEVRTGMIDAALRARLISRHQAVSAAVEQVSRELEADLKLANVAGATSGALEDVALVTLDPVREGHTTAVIRVNVTLRDDTPALFGLNVARDLTGATDEIWWMRSQLNAAAGLDPDGVVQLGEGSFGHCQRFGVATTVPVIPMTWFEGAREIHVIRDSVDLQLGRIILVDEFRPFAGSPGAVLGERLTAEASDTVWAAIVAARTRQAALDPIRDVLTTIAVELNDGDFVLTSMRESVARVALVATSKEQVQMPLGAWPYAMALISARDEADPRAGRLRWGNTSLALHAVRSGLEAHDAGGTLADRMLEDAARMDNQTVAAALSIDPDDANAWELVHALRDVIRPSG